MSYAVRADLKTYLGVTLASDDTLLDDLLVGAQGYVEAYCRRTFEAAADSTRRFDAVANVNGFRLWLDHDLASITSITNGDSTVVAVAQYWVWPRNAVADSIPIAAIDLKPSAGIAWQYVTDSDSAIAIVGRWHHPLHSSIRRAVIRLAAYLYRQKDNSGDLDRPLNLGGGVTVLPGKLPQDVADLLKPFVRHEVRV
jgi:hypothetical protein